MSDFSLLQVTRFINLDEHRKTAILRIRDKTTTLKEMMLRDEFQWNLQSFAFDPALGLAGSLLLSN